MYLLHMPFVCLQTKRASLVRTCLRSRGGVVKLWYRVQSFKVIFPGSMSTRDWSHFLCSPSYCFLFLVSFESLMFVNCVIRCSAPAPRASFLTPNRCEKNSCETCGSLGDFLQSRTQAEMESFLQPWRYCGQTYMCVCICASMYVTCLSKHSRYLLSVNVNQKYSGSLYCSLIIL